MNRIDSIKFEIHKEQIRFNPLKYSERTELDQETGEFKKWYVLKPKYKQLGLNEIIISDKSYHFNKFKAYSGALL